MRFSVACYAAVLAIGAASGASAQVAPARAPPAPVASALWAYIATPSHRAEVAASVRPYLATVPACQQATTRSVSANILSPLTFASDDTLTAGVFKETVKIDGCGTSGILNILTMSRPGAQPLVGALLPGATHADMALQRDALLNARGLAVTKSPGGCAVLSVIDTRFDGFGEVVNSDVAAGRDARQWQETWTFLGCGQQTSVRLTFIPTRTGTHFIASL